MADMYNYWCPFCGQGHSVGQLDLAHFQCPKPDCRRKFQGLDLTKAMVVPKINPISDSPLKFKDMRFSTVATKKIVLKGDNVPVNTDIKVNAAINVTDNTKIDDIGVVIDERDADIGAGAKTNKRGRKKSQRKNKGYIEGNNGEFNID